MSRWIAESLLLFSAWLLFVDRIQGAELLVGAAVAVIAAALTEWLRRRQKIRAALPAGWFRAFSTAMGAAPREAFEVLAARPTVGRFLRVPFAPTDRGARGATRRALAIALTSFSANSIVIDTDARGRFLLLHEAIPKPASEAIRILEGR